MSGQTLLLVLAPVGWAVLCVGIARLTGWARLAEHYRSHGDFADGRWRFQSGGLRWGLGYSGSLDVGANDLGLHLRVFPLFRIGHPPLLVPWDDVTTSEGKRMGIAYTELRFRRTPDVALSIRRRLADKLASRLGERWSELASPPARHT